jgi:hypothetical protein
MRRWQLRQAFVLVLGLFVALGMSLSTVQATNMAAKMAISGKEMASSASDCSSCAGDMGEAKTMACDAVCVAPVIATAPQTYALRIDRPVDRPLTHAPAIHSWAAAPNPHPPQFFG